LSPSSFQPSGLPHKIKFCSTVGMVLYRLKLALIGMEWAGLFRSRRIPFRI
jgi:hypothetical protein